MTCVYSWIWFCHDNMRLLVLGLFYFYFLLLLSFIQLKKQQRKNAIRLVKPPYKMGNQSVWTTATTNQKKKKIKTHDNRHKWQNILTVRVVKTSAHETISRNYQSSILRWRPTHTQISYLTISFESRNRQNDCQMYEGIMCVRACVQQNQQQQQQKQQQHINKSIKLKETHMKHRYWSESEAKRKTYTFCPF